jgi:hypothetical protein
MVQGRFATTLAAPLARVVLVSPPSFVAQLMNLPPASMLPCLAMRNTRPGREECAVSRGSHCGRDD